VVESGAGAGCGVEGEASRGEVVPRGSSEKFIAS
jgi:hypothetical protein